MWLDIVLGAILLISIVIGLWKGFFDSLLGLVSTGLALVVGFTCAKPASAFIAKFIDLPAWIDGLLSKVIENPDQIVSLFGNDSLALKRMELANFLAIVLSGIIVFLVVKIGIWLLAKLFDSVVESSSIGSGLNKLLGGIFGLVKGGAMVIVILLLCSIICGSGITIISNPIQSAIDNSKVTHYVYKYVSDFTENQILKIDLK